MAENKLIASFSYTKYSLIAASSIKNNTISVIIYYIMHPYFLLSQKVFIHSI